MESGNYKVQSSSINVGGRQESSANFKMQETIGEIGTGPSRSSNYQLSSGYQAMQLSFISISAPNDVSMTPAIPGISGGAASGSAAWTVKTDNLAGYQLKITSSTLPALRSGSVSFLDYTPVAVTPDYNWQIAATDSEFGFSPEGTDIVARFKDNGSSTCGIGGNDTAGKCWDHLSTTDTTICSRNSSNHPAGTISTVKFRAESGASHLQLAGTYTATITVTGITL